MLVLVVPALIRDGRLQAAKDEWGRVPIFNVAVWPFADGDVVVQPYAPLCVYVRCLTFGADITPCVPLRLFNLTVTLSCACTTPTPPPCASAA